MVKDTFDVFCPTCNILVEAKVIAHGSGKHRSDAVSPIEEVECEYHCERYAVAICRRCSGPFLVRESLFGVPGEFENVTDEAVLYPVAGGPTIEGLPASIRRAVGQAHRSYTTASYDACAVMCRLALEALCKSFSAKGKNLERQLAELESHGRIDSRLLSWAHGVRLVGNEGAHDTDAAVTAEDARDILEFTDALLMYVYTLDTKFRSFDARRKGRVKKPSTGMPQPDAAPNSRPPSQSPASPEVKSPDSLRTPSSGGCG